ncbi:MAG TPA: metallophosphoesterase [Verrucomicrobiota bacterium]|nr:metallophosphoesterase [Verrucomicrobiota bacterium]HNU50602.1 metallophosphoesterase [Verrucomicrobiota bacterium]
MERESGSALALRGVLGAVLLVLTPGPAVGAVLFQDDFNRGIPGWTAVQPEGAYQSGPLRWQYDIVSSGFVEQSNIYTDNASYSPTAIAPMLINDTVTGSSFVFGGQLTAGDDDGFGLVFGFTDEDNFYRVTFARQARTAGFPWTGWSVDRKVNGATETLFGGGTAGYSPTFVNSAGVPFHATVGVDTSNRLTLTVIDSPSGSPMYPLVVNKPLPGPAAGRVGLFTWGMSGGSGPLGFRIGGLQLLPSGLAGDANALAGWTPVVPPRANGSTLLGSGNLQPLWSLCVGAQGPYGVLVENSDCYGGNDTAGQVDFTGPTLVAGDVAWKDYVVHARVLPRDDDAHGILLRYANLTNFYRVALRSQSSAMGPPRGLSVQKCINGVYGEVYRESAVRYDPVAGVPYDLVVAIRDQTLDVHVVADPDGVAASFAHGPMTVTGPAVEAGKVGLFSWAMAMTEFDAVSVQDGAPLYVSSPCGSPDPPRGLNAYAAGATVTATAGEAVLDGGTRRSPRGWTGWGSVPASGAGAAVTFPVDAVSGIHWQWRTEHQLTVTSAVGGSVVVPPGEWFEAGTRVTVTAVPEPGYAFAGWRGDLIASSPALALTMDRPYGLTATFSRDSDADGLRDEWELGWFGDLAALPDGDPDGDGRVNAEEQRHGSHPRVPDVFRIEHFAVRGGLGVLTVSNNAGTRYSVQRAADPGGPWSTVHAAQSAATVTSVLSSPRAVYRLSQPALSSEVLPFVPGSWTLAVLPDTQVYAMSYPDLFQDQTRWIAENRERHNIQYVLHLGDVTNNNLTNQWAVAQAAFALLDGRVPYAIAPGNHDYGANGGTGDRTTWLNDFFPVTKYAAWPTFGGVKEAGRLDNSYHLFSAGGVDWLVLALEFGPRDSVVAWANEIVARYPSRRVILITHAFVYNDDTRYDWATKGTAQSWNPHAYATASDPDGTNDGEELWRKLVTVHPNFTMVISGHVLNDGLGRLSTRNDAGHMVHQMLVNYQMQTMGGEAVLRLIEFLPDGRTVQVKAYSPYNGSYKTDPQNQFILTLDPPLR